jgi:outer membrane immunogenic protein
VADIAVETKNTFLRRLGGKRSITILQSGDALMFKRSGLKLCSLTAGALAAVILCNGAASASPPEDGRILEKLAALEARISALETENREYKRQAAEAHAQDRKSTDKLLRMSNAAVPNTATPTQIYKSQPPSQAEVSWTGAFWGVSAGGGATHSRVTSTEHITESFPTNPPPFTISGMDTLGTSGPGNATGAMIDLFAGWNTQISNVVVGAQLEATAANLNFSSTGTKQYTYFDGNGPTGQTATDDFRPQVVSQWMATALLRAGVLLNDHTLVYGIGGWTLAQFEARNVTDNPFYQPVETFLANGWTAGTGIERKLDSNWSVRAEYRYTSFGTARTDDHFTFQSSAPSSTQTYQRQTQYDQSMQTGRIGFVYAFNPMR